MNLLKDLRHPRVVLLVGVCTSGRLPIMILEYMANGSLYDYLHNAQKYVSSHACRLVAQSVLFCFTVAFGSNN